MAGLETIAMAVAHLERLKDDDEEEEDGKSASSPLSSIPPAQVVSDRAINGPEAAAPPSPGTTLQTRMVSTDTSSTARRSPVEESADAPTSHPNATSAKPTIIKSESTTRLPSSSHQPPQHHKHASSSELAATAALEQQPSSVLVAATAGMGGPVAVLLNAVASITDNLDEFFLLMNQLEQVALAAEPSGVAADVPKADEAIVQVQRNDVLLGRGGETNHHVGNIHYRQLVKACQPAYLAAKRRDKPRIAAAIVGVVRARSGRFCKKHTSDNVWRDVGNTRAREKTSQALREGAPELRGTVEASRTYLLQEAVESSRAQRLLDAANNSNASSAGVGHEGGINVVPAFTAGAIPPPMEYPHDISRRMGGPPHHPSSPDHVRGAGVVDYHHIHPGAPMYYHHHHQYPHPHHTSSLSPKFMYHHSPPMAMEQQQQQQQHFQHPTKLSGKRPMSAAGASPPPKRTATALKSSPTGSNSHATSIAAPSTSTTGTLGESSLAWDTISEKATTSNVTFPVAISAEHSEEEPAAQTNNPAPRAASPASSTSSSKESALNARGTGPRVKLLKNRREDTVVAAV